MAHQHPMSAPLWGEWRAHMIHAAIDPPLGSWRDGSVRIGYALVTNPPSRPRPPAPLADHPFNSGFGRSQDVSREGEHHACTRQAKTAVEPQGSATEIVAACRPCT